MASKRYTPRRPTRARIQLMDAQNRRGGAAVTTLPLSAYIDATSATSRIQSGEKQFPDMSDNADKPDKPNVQPVGASGTAIMAGIVQSEEYNSDFYWRDAIRVYEMMRRNDAQIWVAERMVTLPLERAKWSIKPASDASEDVQVASFVQTCLMEGMHYTTSEGIEQVQTWQQLLQHILLMMPMGFSVFAKWWTIDDDGYVRWAQWQPLLARSIWKWWVGPDNKLVGVQQRSWKNYRWEYEDIHASRLIRFTHRQEGDNLDGWSILRPIYKHWFYLDNLYKIQVLTVERSATLPPIGVLAPDDMDQSAADNLLTQLANMRVSEQMGVVIRHNQDIRFPANHQRGESEAMRAIEHHDMKIARAILAPFLNLGSTETGAYNLAQQQVQTFLESLQAVATFIEDQINVAIRELVDYNFTGVEVYPKLSCEPLQKADLATLTPLLSYLDPQGQDPQLQDFIRKLVGAPSAPASLIESTTGTDEENGPETPPEGDGAGAGAESGTTASEGDDYALLLSESVEALERYDVVDRGMVFYNHNHDRTGKFAPGSSSGAGTAGGAGGAGKGAAKGGGGGGGGGGAPKAAKAASATKSTKAPAAPKAKAAPKAGAKAGKAAAVIKTAAKPKEPNVAELKAAAEARVKVATAHVARTERAMRVAERAAEQARATNAAEITRLSNERHAAFVREFESHGEVRDLLAEERAHANGQAGKAPAAYAKMLAAKQPMEEARAAYGPLRATAQASRAHYETLMNRYSANHDLMKPGVYEGLRKAHPDLKAAQKQSWKDESAAEKAKYAMWRKENTYKSARDTVAGITGAKGKAAHEAAVEAHPTRIAAKAALAAADARLGAATGETARRAAYDAREAARNELKDAQRELSHPTWKYPLHSAPTEHAQYTHPDQFPAGTLAAARAADPSGLIDKHAGDRALAELVHAQRFDGKPDIVSEAELNARIKAGEVELWRGDTKPGHTDNFMMGDYHAGIGVHGSGTYTALASAGGRDVARTYAKSSGNDGNIMRMSVKKDARVIEYDHLKELAHQAVEHAQRQETAARARGDKAGVERAQTLHWLALGNTERGSSRYAVALGYDAISVNTSRTLKGQWIILNRTALRISHQVRGD